jgi:uncharacterized protein (DUF1499 family)
MLNKACAGAGMLSILCLAGGMALARLELISPMAGLLSLAMGGLLGLVGLVLAGFVLVSTQSLPVAFTGIAGLVPLSLMTVLIVNALRYPRINDIATDLEHVPPFVHAPTLPENQGRDMAFPEGNQRLIAEHYPVIRPVIIAAPPADVYAIALETAESSPDWEVTWRDDASHTFEGIATTTVYRFRDDFVVRITPAEDGGSQLDMRSKSRIGQSDLGANAQRIAAFLEVVRRAARGQR